MIKHMKRYVVCFDEQSDVDCSQYDNPIPVRRVVLEKTKKWDGYDWLKFWTILSLGYFVVIMGDFGWVILK